MLVVSDLEGTLTTGGTVRGWVAFQRERDRSLGFRIAIYWQLLRYTLERMFGNDQNARVRLLGWMMQRLKGSSREEFDQFVKWLLEQELWPKRREDVIAELDEHRKAGHRVVIVSGTFAPIAEAFARSINVEAIGTPLDYDSAGRLTGKIAGSVSVRAEKVERIRRLANGEGIHAAYGDTEADIPMLEIAEQPVAVYPDKDLRKEAVRRGWRILGSL